MMMSDPSCLTLPATTNSVVRDNLVPASPGPRHRCAHRCPRKIVARCRGPVVLQRVGRICETHRFRVALKKGAAVSNEKRTSLEHLPVNKQGQLRAITNIIHENTTSLEMVILFGSHARGDWVSDPVNLYFSDFDIMVVLGDPSEAEKLSLWDRITRETQPITDPASVNLMPMHFKEVNKEIRVGHYFFADVVSEGIWLYDRGNISLATPKAKTPEERLKFAEFNFRHWFESAGNFWVGTGYYMTMDMPCQAAFLLHQATERYYHTVLLVYTGTKPKSHHIGELADRTAPLHEALADAMPREAGEEKRLFDLLKRSYIESRYSKMFRITLDELRVLRKRVSDLADRVRIACVDRLSQILGPEAVSELSYPPGQDDTDAFPPAPDMGDTEAVDQWKQAVAEQCEARGRDRWRNEGRQLGREEGLLEGEKRGHEKGLVEGELRGQRTLVRKLLEQRFDSVSQARIAQIEAATPEDLDTWVEKLLTAASLDDVFV
jgi:uncharacterized protein